MKEINSYDRNLDFHKYKSENEFQINLIKFLKKKILKGNEISILEIGVGNGFLNKYIKKNFNLKEHIILDNSSDCLELVKNVDKKIKFNLDQDSFFDIKDLKDNSLDLILIFEVLEHLRWPNLTIEMLYKKLKKGGILVASTPNINWYEYRLSFLIGNDVEHFHNTNHVRYWNLKSFKNLFKKYKILYHFTDFVISRPFSYLFFKKIFIKSDVGFCSSLFGRDQVLILKKI
jgi:2-polyprenyl-3-methyl-5-hydroxy-6-metoxy-1,4-benzoquinol methylase